MIPYLQGLCWIKDKVLVRQTRNNLDKEKVIKEESKLHWMINRIVMNETI